jgi:predicted dinucleotide-binding enzyme
MRRGGMKVAIIGMGGMGGGFARWLAKEHEVAIGSRDAEKGRSSTGLRGSATPPQSTASVSSSLLI